MEANNTIFGAVLEQAEGPLLGEADGTAGRVSVRRQFKIRAANDAGHRSAASILIERRYAWRGYQNASLPKQATADRITLSATESDVSIGTITIGLDGPEAILAEQVFPEEVAELRKAGRRICEFTKLAVDPVSGSRRILASLFHSAYIVAHRLRGYDTLLLEVNPRHVAYYRRMLGCRVLGKERINPRVDAPAVLLCVDFAHIMKQIEIFGGRPEMASIERSLYPFAFSAVEEAGIISRMQRVEQSTVETVH